ncbi:MAG: hypothetical protein ABUS79_13245 [Pseudomonadota bacterium]
MSDEVTGAVTCGAAVERMVEAGGQPAGSAVEAHVRSCMSCFRAMTDLRDLPRVADAVRAAAPPEPAPDDRFWDALARRTTDAVAVAVAAGVPAAADRRSGAAPRAASRRFRTRRPGAVYTLGAVAVAAAAGWAVMFHRPAAPGGATIPAAATASLSHDDGGDEALSDVAELDSNALRRLLDRLGRHAPAALAGGTREVSDTRDSTDTADIPADDEPRVSDEVADLDGDALRRVASSLHGAAL